MKNYCKIRTVDYDQQFEIQRMLNERAWKLFIIQNNGFCPFWFTTVNVNAQYYECSVNNEKKTHGYKTVASQPAI